MTAAAEKHEFQADVAEVLSIVVNSLYSHKEVFLRELISNASDSLDHFSFKCLTEHELQDGDELRIEIIPDKLGRTLTVRDNGVGMSRDELVSNLGTIARSGSRELMKTLRAEAKNDLSLIGQFGVGFYSAYLVAEEVEVISRAAGSDEAWSWRSDAKSEFFVEPAERSRRGTDVILRLREGEDEFLDEWTLKGLVRKYSDFVRYPIVLHIERDKDGDKEVEEETINNARALWARPKSEIPQEQYHEFYKHLTHDWKDPLAYTHFKVEGAQSLTGILFVPGTAPLDLFEPKSRGVRLFVRRVFIMDDVSEMLPEWLRFLRGVIDSEDLPLNVSREMLQQDKSTKFIRKQIVHKALVLLEELAAEGEITRTPEAGEDKGEVRVRRFDELWREFGRVLKEGVHYDFENKERIAKLLRYKSSLSEGWTSLSEYLLRMKSDQPGIYYLTAETLEAAQGSPHIEALQKKSYEVLFMTDPIDEWVVQSLAEFEGRKLISAAKGSLDLPESDQERKQRTEQKEEYESLLVSILKALGERVKEVRITDRLTESPACLVTDAHGLSPHLERILRANGREVPAQKRILEVNPEHAVIAALKEMVEDENKAAEVEDWCRLLFDQALVAEGSLPEDPGRFARSVSKLMEQVAQLPPQDPAS